MRKLLLCLILVLAFSIRAFHVSSDPPSLYWDEVAMGYNVYSLIKTGADEYGHKLPFFFESFQDYKLPGYIYSTTLISKFIGVSDFSVRLPAVIFGTLGIWFLYLLIKKLLDTKIALLSAFSLAVSPWHIQFTRAGYEASASFAFVILGMYFLYMGLERKIFFHLGYCSMVLAICFYNGSRDDSLGVFAFFLIFFWNKLKINKKDIFIGSVIFLIFILPIAIQFLSPASFIRFSYISVFNDKSALSQLASERLQDQNKILGALFHNKYIYYTNLIMKNYLAHFSPNFLFFGEDGNPRHSVMNIGLIYIWRLPFIIWGALKLLEKRSTSLKLLLPLLFTAPIASAFTIPSPHALRSFEMLPVILVFSAYGVIYFFRILTKFKYFLILVLVSISSFTLAQYLHEYHVNYPIYSSRDWAYGYKQVFDFIKATGQKYNNIYITGKYWRPYIFALYYLQYPPEKYQQHISHNQIDNIYFGYPGYDSSDPYYNYQAMKNIPEELSRQPGNLFINAPDENNAFGIQIKTLNDLEGNPMFLFIETGR